MDNLSKDMIQCKADGYGFHYGKWKAMQKPVPIVKKAIPDGWIVCQNCGKPFKPKTKRAQKFCEVLCQKEAYAKTERKKHTEYMREYRARKGEET